MRTVRGVPSRLTASRLKAAWMRASFSGSANAVASSSTTIGASFRMARASMSRCTSPPDR